MIKVDVNWKAFLISELFDVNIRGRRLTLTEREDGDYPFVTAGENNNGISSFINNHNQAEYNNSITLDMFGNSFYQDWKFKCDDNITILKNNLTNKYSSIFIAALLNRLRVKYSYGNQVRPNRLKNDRVMLPVDSKGKPDYKFMESFIKKIEKLKTDEYNNFITSKIKKLVGIKEPEKIEAKEFKEYFIEDIFQIKSGKRLIKADMKIGNIPFIGATDSNNGITEYISNINSSLDSNVLGVNYNGSVVENFYHPYKAIFSDDVKRLSFKEIEGNKYQFLFIKTLILMQKSKYEYGYKFNGERMKRQKIILPINEKGNPDYQYMEDYMKYLEYQKLKEYLEFKK